MKIKTQEISLSILKEKECRLIIKRIDLIHKEISGNKWYKLKYNLIEARKQNFDTILTFGGAFSNHIAATAFEANLKGFKSIGIIRGEEHLPLNPTLKLAKENGMTFHYISRNEYREKDAPEFIKYLYEKFGNFYLLPEGGTNHLAIKGTEEILDQNDIQDFICSSIGTGGTISGIINSKLENQIVLGFPAIKRVTDLRKYISEMTNNNMWNLIEEYHFGGYAKITNELIDFIQEFYNYTKIPLDAIYTGKMMFGLIDLVSKGFFPKGSTILFIHTGGLQGNIGLNLRLDLNLPTK